MPSDKDEDPIYTVLTFINDNLHVACDTDDIEAAHPLPPKSPPAASSSSDSHPSGSFPRCSFIVRFRRNKIRIDVLKERRNLKGTGISISEDLTSLNSQLLKRLHNDDRISSLWSWNGRVFATDVKSSKKFSVKPFSSYETILFKFSPSGYDDDDAQVA